MNNMNLHDIVNIVLSRLGEPYADKRRKQLRQDARRETKRLCCWLEPVNEEYLSLANAAEGFLTDIYLEIVGVPWPHLPGNKLTVKIGWPHSITTSMAGADAGSCADDFMSLLKHELSDRGMAWPEWRWY